MSSGAGETVTSIGRAAAGRVRNPDAARPRDPCRGGAVGTSSLAGGATDVRTYRPMLGPPIPPMLGIAPPGPGLNSFLGGGLR